MNLFLHMHRHERCVFANLAFCGPPEFFLQPRHSQAMILTKRSKVIMSLH
jgi:hypothetical protein